MCCGKKRAELLQTGQANQPAPVYFQYVGNTGLTVQGRETRKRYRFDHPGAVVAVDVEDRPSLASVPNLRPAFEKPGQDTPAA